MKQSYPAWPIDAEDGGRIESQLDNITLLSGRSYSNDDELRKFKEGSWVAKSQGKWFELTSPKDAYEPMMNPQLHLAFVDFVWTIKVALRELGFREALTPSLVSCPGTEPSLHPLKVDHRFLPTSPEINLKKLLSLNLGPLFEVKPAFRAREHGPHHLEEFSMLEWYRPCARLEQIQEDVLTLIHFLCEHFGKTEPELSLVSIPDLFRDELNQEILPSWGLQEYRICAKNLQVNFSESDSEEDIFFRIFLEKLEQKLPKDKLLILSDYPPFLAAYARISEDGWADRFEVYWKGLELGNAFHELNDPEEQELRMKRDNEKKRSQGQAPVPLDEDFLRAMRMGVPPSAGIAMGVERVFMAIFDIDEIRLFRDYSSQMEKISPQTHNSKK